MEELKYALLNDELVHISSVERGIKCGCVCPNCRSILVAKKGDKNAHHFAHYITEDCNHGSETALHMMAKNIIAKRLALWVPVVPKNEYDDTKAGKIVSFEKAEIERKMSDSIRSDVLLHVGDRLLNVEIKVTHEIDERKTIEIFNLGVSTVEIDLCDIKNDFNPEMVEKILMEGTRTKLVFSHKNKALYAKLLLCEWKKIHHNRYGDYVDNCPLSNRRAYFINTCHKGGKDECHECRVFHDYYMFQGEMLCRGILDNFDFKKIDQIVSFKKFLNHLIYVKLILNDGSVFETSSKLHR